jgi:DNA-binding MarR family transcriptional regulator
MVRAKASTAVEHVEQDSREMFALALRATDAVDIDISPGGLRALLALDAVDSCSLNDLATQLVLSASATSRLVDRLVSAGLADRQEAPEDRRRIAIQPTAAGRRETEVLIEERRKAFDAVMRRMDDTDRGRLERGLAAFAAAARERPTDSGG